MQIGDSEFVPWDGYHTEFWCDVELLAVIKAYSPDYKYLGYFTNDGIPF